MTLDEALLLYTGQVPRSIIERLWRGGSNHVLNTKNKSIEEILAIEVLQGKLDRVYILADHILENRQYVQTTDLQRFKIFLDQYEIKYTTLRIGNSYSSSRRNIPHDILLVKDGREEICFVFDVNNKYINYNIERVSHD
jgi:hypothetical protein